MIYIILLVVAIILIIEFCKSPETGKQDHRKSVHKTPTGIQPKENEGTGYNDFVSHDPEEASCESGPLKKSNDHPRKEENSSNLDAGRTPRPYREPAPEPPAPQFHPEQKKFSSEPSNQTSYQQPIYSAAAPSFKTTESRYPDSTAVSSAHRSPSASTSPDSPAIHNSAELSYLRSRGVRYLIHFTPVENLPNIMKHGILPVQTLQSIRIPYTKSDPNRIDGMEFASCFSISYPNYRYFYKIRQKREYAILRIDISALAFIPENRISYFRTNAAAAENRNRFDQCHGLEALQELFRPLDTMSRETQMIPSRYPTNPQAEVVIAEKIPPNYIREIHVRTLAERERAEAAVQRAVPQNSAEILCRTEMFNARSDYKIWKVG